MKKLFKHLVDFLDLRAYERRVSDQLHEVESRNKSLREIIFEISELNTDTDSKLISTEAARLIAINFKREKEQHELFMNVLSNMRTR